MTGCWDFKIFTAMTIPIKFFSAKLPCWLVGKSRSFRKSCCLRLQHWTWRQNASPKRQWICESGTLTEIEFFTSRVPFPPATAAVMWLPLHSIDQTYHSFHQAQPNGEEKTKRTIYCRKQAKKRRRTDCERKTNHECHLAAFTVNTQIEAWNKILRLSSDSAVLPPTSCVR